MPDVNLFANFRSFFLTIPVGFDTSNSHNLLEDGYRGVQNFGVWTPSLDSGEDCFIETCGTLQQFCTLQSGGVNVRLLSPGRIQTQILSLNACAIRVRCVQTVSGDRTFEFIPNTIIHYRG